MLRLTGVKDLFLHDAVDTICPNDNVGLRVERNAFDGSQEDVCTSLA